MGCIVTLSSISMPRESATLARVVWPIRSFIENIAILNEVLWMNLSDVFEKDVQDFICLVHVYTERHEWWVVNLLIFNLICSVLLFCGCVCCSFNKYCHFCIWPLVGNLRFNPEFVMSMYSVYLQDNVIYGVCVLPPSHIGPSNPTVNDFAMFYHIFTLPSTKLTVYIVYYRYTDKRWHFYQITPQICQMICICRVAGVTLCCRRRHL